MLPKLLSVPYSKLNHPKNPSLISFYLESGEQRPSAVSSSFYRRRWSWDTSSTKDQSLQGDHVQTVLRNFVSKTGMHAVPNIASENNRSFRAVWTILLLLAITLLARQIYSLTVKLTTRPTATKTSLQFESPLDFPAVTICNLNPMKLQGLRQSRTEHNGVGKSIRRRRQVANLNRIRRNNKRLNSSTSLDKLKKIFAGGGGAKRKPMPISSFIEFSDSPVRQNHETEEFTLKENVLYLMNNLELTQFQQLKNSLEDMLYSCSFLGKPCYVSDFQELTNTRYGTCYIFNSGMNRDGQSVPIRTVNSSGSINGLEMMLFVDQDSYLPNIAVSAGFKLLIHDSTEVPLPDQDGYLVGPGRFTAFGIRKSTLKRAKQPYGQCKDFTPAENVSMNMFLKKMPRTQPTMKVCIRTCEQLQILTYCKCYSLYHGYANAKAFDKVNRIFRGRACEVEPDSEDYNCTHDILRLIASGNFSCQTSMCRFHECISHRFQVSQSSSAWPSDSSMRYVLQLAERKMPTRRLTQRFVERNFLKVLIYFEDLSVIRMETVPSYTFIDFVSDLGGQGGLWLGISAFTILELIVLIFELTRIFICSGKSGKKEEKKKKELRR